jgi:hypothetical protein
MQVQFSPESLDEMLLAQQWYEVRSMGLGTEFARAVDAGASLIEIMPLAYPLIRSPYRHCVLKRFPYSLIYRVTRINEIDTAVVVSCHHHRMRPRFH